MTRSTRFVRFFADGSRVLIRSIRNMISLKDMTSSLPSCSLSRAMDRVARGSRVFETLMPASWGISGLLLKTWATSYTLYERHYQVLTRKLHEGAASCSGDRVEWKRYVDLCLDATTKCWAESFRRYMDENKLSTALELIELCLSLGRAAACQPILSGVVPKHPYNTWDEYCQLLKPWILRLCSVLSRFGLSFTSPPFDDFARHIAGVFIRDIVGTPQPKNMKAQPTIPKIGCGCESCEALGAFLTSSQEEMELRVPRDSADHLNEPLRHASPIIGSYVKSSSQGPFRVFKLEKEKLALIACRDANRASDAKALFEDFGGTTVILELMGNRLDDVQRTLNQRKPFTWPDDYLARTWDPASAPATAAAITVVPETSKRKKSEAKSDTFVKMQKKT
ncbi:hypothetical protein BDN72DRAFT_210309 [Pluteus cervinus]|uniref:Uncharacterized protein n=1 Tax=Pluteus cervinus TaxID=181527 RepID=A0ACD3AI85_9AGAR|nr:hypothetical protein BDN72DRAFT_210309 [Pluteus cervinus]